MVESGPPPRGGGESLHHSAGLRNGSTQEQALGLTTRRVSELELELAALVRAQVPELLGAAGPRHPHRRQARRRVSGKNET
jgi:hypothetical protein